ncbi:hypothetical protein ACJIZ3_024367 [Penstemon smallii]|uniref:Uncharacterized protein n=1 Tax=Penstemon smallii TaxID=265156 RepID=A0ABD3TTA5_9LAMI
MRNLPETTPHPPSPHLTHEPIPHPRHPLPFPGPRSIQSVSPAGINDSETRRVNFLEEIPTEPRTQHSSQIFTFFAFHPLISEPKYGGGGKRIGRGCWGRCFLNFHSYFPFYVIYIEIN